MLSLDIWHCCGSESAMKMAGCIHRAHSQSATGNHAPLRSVASKSASWRSSHRKVGCAGVLESAEVPKQDQTTTARLKRIMGKRGNVGSCACPLAKTPELCANLELIRD